MPKFWRRTRSNCACGSAASDHARLRLGRLRDLVAASRLGLTGRAARVELPGGALTIAWREADDHVLMTGPVVFEREIELKAEMFAGAGRLRRATLSEPRPLCF